MSVTYRLIDSELVSVEWLSFLTKAREAGVRFRINEGHRTFARQLWFWNCMRSKKCNNGNLAARPSPFAPHIRTGRIDHAIDTDELGALIEYGRKVGVRITRTVRGESWHGEAPAADLRAFHTKHNEPTDEEKWRASRERRRDALRRVLARRAQLRKDKQTGTAVYRETTGQMTGLKRTIAKLTRLIGRRK